MIVLHQNDGIISEVTLNYPDMHPDNVAVVLSACASAYEELDGADNQPYIVEINTEKKSLHFGIHEWFRFELMDIVEKLVRNYNFY